MAKTKTRRLIPNTRKFGSKRYILKWDSATFTAYRDPDSKAGIAEKKTVAKMWLKDYTDDNWQAKMTTYNKGRDFKVWALPRER